MLLLPETQTEKNLRVIRWTLLFTVIFSYFAFQVSSSILSSSACQKQMQPVSQSNCDAAGVCLVTTEQGHTFTAKNVLPDSLVAVEICQ